MWILNPGVGWARFPKSLGRLLFLGFWALGAVCAWGSGPFYINELFFNPPAGDAPYEYIEIRGLPNAVLPPGSFLIGIEGDKANEPGTVQDIFDLSGLAMGGNGFLVLLQKHSPYNVDPLGNSIIHSGANSGWGSGSDSSVHHRGELGQTDIENASVTFMLGRSDSPILIGQDLDSDNDGYLDPAFLEEVEIWDSVGILDTDGAGDIAYGDINFRRISPPGNGATAHKTIVPLGFTPTYVARLANSTGFKASDWVVSEVPPPASPDSEFLLGDGNHTFPISLAGARLNHFGAPNFGAPLLPGFSIGALALASPLSELGGTNAYSVTLTRNPTSPVTLAVEAQEGLEVSVDGGKTYLGSASLTFHRSGAQSVFLRAVDNSVVEPSPRILKILHHVVAPAPPEYAAALVPNVEIAVVDDEWLVLSEVCVNPVAQDQQGEFVELQGAPSITLQGVYLMVLESSGKGNPGSVKSIYDLSGQKLGRNGILLMASPDNDLPIPDSAVLFAVPEFGQPGGALPNDSLSFLLVATLKPPQMGDDLDQGDNGVLEGLPKDARILDSLSWIGGGPNDVAYGAQLLPPKSFIPDAASRFLGDVRPSNPEAWYFGDLKGGVDANLKYDRSLSSANLPLGAVLTPGIPNTTPPTLSKPESICGAIGDPTNPSVFFSIDDLETPVTNLIVTASSKNLSVVSNEGLVLTSLGGGQWKLDLIPHGVGYSSITIRVSDGVLSSETTFNYAASQAESDRTRYMIGAGDGSTAIPLKDNLVLIGDDENQVLRVYDRTRSNRPLAKFNMTPFLGLQDLEGGIPREVDIEGSTRVGNRLFWMGAHSHANNAEIRVNRGRIFATDLVDAGTETTLSYVGRYDYLLQDLIAWDAQNRHGKGADYYGIRESAADGVDPKAPDGSGFNLEGLTMAPGSSEVAYVACRAPLAPAKRRHFALLFTVLNFASLAASDAPAGSAVFGPPIELDLFDRGIRSIEGVEDHYLIVAGPAGPAVAGYPQDFRLYTWTGQPGDLPELRSTSLRGLNPEGIVELPALPWINTREVQLLSDSGTRVWYGDGVITKELPEVNFKKCRLDWVAMGDGVPPEPILVDIQSEAGGTTIRWRSVAGHLYRVQSTPDLTTPSWEDVQEDVEANDVFSAVLDKRGSSSQRYYRILALK